MSDEAMPRESQIGGSKTGRWGLFWPQISDLESARTAAKVSRSLATLFAVAIAVAGIWSELGGDFPRKMGIDGRVLVQAALYGLIAWGLHRMNRVAAVAGLLLFIGARVMALTYGQHPGFGGAVVSVLMILGFINGIRGTFKYHNYLRAQKVDSESGSTPRP